MVEFLLCRYDVEEDFGAVVFVCLGRALGGFEGAEAEVEEGGAVGEEECFFAFTDIHVLV